MVAERGGGRTGGREGAAAQRLGPARDAALAGERSGKRL